MQGTLQNMYAVEPHRDTADTDPIDSALKADFSCCFSKDEIVFHLKRFWHDTSLQLRRLTRAHIIPTWQIQQTKSLAVQHAIKQLMQVAGAPEGEELECVVEVYFDAVTESIIIRAASTLELSVLQQKITEMLREARVEVPAVVLPISLSEALNNGGLES